MSIEWKRKLTILGIVAGTILVYRYLLPVILPFLAAWFLAACLYPVALHLQKLTKIKRNIWNMVLLLTVIAAAALLFYFGARELLEQLRTAVTNLPELVDRSLQFLDDFCIMLENITGIEKETSRSCILSRMSVMQKEMAEVWGSGAFAGIQSVVKKLIVFFSGTVVILIGTILILNDMENIRRKIREYSWLMGVHRVLGQLKKTTAVYLRAQVIIMVLVGAVCTIGFWVMRSPYFLIFGISLGFLDALPVIGTGTFLYPTALWFLIKGNFAAAAGCVLLDVLTSILREYLEPKLLGGKLGISPIAVLASVYIGIFLYGGWGVFLGPLSFSTIYESGKVWDIWD